jgi:hypothetical protein
MSQKLLITITIGDIKSKVLEWFNNRMNTENMIQELNNKIKSIKGVSIYELLILTNTVGEQEKLFVYVEFTDKYEIGILQYILQQIFKFNDEEWRERTEIVDYTNYKKMLRPDNMIFSHDFMDNMDISETPPYSPQLNDNSSPEKTNVNWDMNKNRLFQQQLEQHTREQNTKRKRKNIEKMEKELRLSKLKFDPVNQDLYNELKNPVNTIYKHRDARLKKEAEAQRAVEEARRKEEEAMKAAEEARRRQEEAQKAAEEARRRQEEAQKASEKARRRQEEAQKASEKARRRQEEAQKASEKARRREEEARRKREEQAREKQTRPNIKETFPTNQEKNRENDPDCPSKNIKPLIDGTTKSEIKKSYRKQSLLFHPDKNKKCQKDSQEKFTELSNMYQQRMDSVRGGKKTKHYRNNKKNKKTLKQK